LRGLISDCDPPTSASHVAEITDLCHHAWLNPYNYYLLWSDFGSLYILATNPLSAEQLVAIFFQLSLHTVDCFFFTVQKFFSLV
jgi:hypothetical protein